MAEKMRLDCALVERGLCSGRDRAKAFIMAGQVYVNNQKSDKAGLNVKADDKIEVRCDDMPFVSRGGYKLEKAMKSFSINLDGSICADIGASTGGFTDCMLQSGAVKVFAVDVGYGQLAWKLRCDKRVVNLERCNFRYATREQITDMLDFASVDVSFISLTIILPVLHEFLNDGGTSVCLIKPQFEAGRNNVGKNGVIRDPAVHTEVINRITNFMTENGFSVLGLDFSPIKGPKGNIEYLAYIKKDAESEFKSEISVDELVKMSHNVLDEIKA